MLYIDGVPFIICVCSRASVKWMFVHKTVTRNCSLMLNRRMFLSDVIS